MKRPTVILLHGLARTARSMARLKTVLEQEGYQTWSRSYPSRRHHVAALAAAVAQEIQEELGDGPFYAVTHSMGGILLRFLADKLLWRGAVMLAPPNRGSRVAAALASHPLFKWFYGPAGTQMGDPPNWPDPPRPLGIIAGNSGKTIGNPPSWAIAAMGLIPAHQPHDGTLTVEETRCDGASAFATVPASHTWIMNHPQTLALILRFFETQQFGAPII